MHYRTLGRTGIHVSPNLLGAMMFGTFGDSGHDATAAILGPRTMEQLDDLLAGAEVVLTDDVLDRIDAIVPPGTGIGQLDMAYNPPGVVTPAPRRRPAGERAAA